MHGTQCSILECWVSFSYVSGQVELIHRSKEAGSTDLEACQEEGAPFADFALHIEPQPHPARKYRETVVMTWSPDRVMPSTEGLRLFRNKAETFGRRGNTVGDRATTTFCRVFSLPPMRGISPSRKAQCFEIFGAGYFLNFDSCHRTLNPAAP